jgi:regulator of cell morphogenesis and NO signaling
MVKGQLQGASDIGKASFGSVKNPIEKMMQEHDNEGERFREISALSHNYTVPQDACNTFKVSYSKLKEFEEDLHAHIHLENNILFPKAIELEKELSDA